MMRKDFIIYIPGLVLLGLFVVGWVMNIVEICKAIHLPITGIFIIKCIGVFVAPLGAVMGYL